jgi:oligopeptide/dipeptide ABC transporter ATP-binding protein
LIADEPTTALDVTIEAQILALIKDMQLAEESSLIIITHDLGVIAEMADQVIVMYVGKVVESGSTREVLEDPRHPYTSALLQSVPHIGRRERLKPISGSVPNLYALPEGCVFAPRCPRAMDLCRAEEPPEFTIAEGRRVKCWLLRDQATGAA